MAASQEQKLDYLLKKIGYVSSKTGIAEDENTLSGTKKAPFAEPIPSPLVVPSTNIWADSSSIPSTPPGADTNYVQVYLAGSSGHRMTVDSTVSGNRTFIAYSTYNNTSTDILGDWIDPSFGSDYIIKVYKGDPNSGGVLLSAAGTASNDTWFFDYSSGVLNFNGSQVPSGVTSSNIYIVGYRYIGNKGAASPVDVKWFDTAVGIWTSSSVGIGTTNATSTLTVDGTLNVSGVSTFVGDVSFGSTVTFGDNDKIILGDGEDLQIYHNGSDSYISDQGVGTLRILTNKLQVKNTTDNGTSAVFNVNGAVSLNHSNSTKFQTTGVGVSIVNGTSDTATIYGPSNLIIDPMPVGVGTTSGIVRIKGDLYVDGTQFVVASSTIELADFVVGIATTVPNDILLDGAGIGIGTNKTFLYEYNSGNNPSLKSSENLNVASGKHYQIGETEVLSSTTLGSGVTNSSLTSLGTIATGVWQGTAINDDYIDTINNADKVSLSALNIDGGTDIGALLSDGDLFIVDDGANGTNRKADILGITTYTFGKVSGDILISAAGTATIQANSVGLGTDTFGQYASTITGGDGLTATTPNSDDGTAYTIAVGAGTGITVNADDVAIKNADNLTDNKVVKWDDGNGQLTDSVITDDGTNIGIGTDNPLQKLHVKGTIQVDGTTNAINGNYSRIYQNSSGSVDYGLQLKHYQGDTNNVDASILIGGDTSSREGNIVFYRDVSGTFTETARFDENGNFGIGISPTARLDVRRDASTAYDPTDDDAQRTNTSTISIRNEDGTTNSFAQLTFDTAGTNQSIARIVAIRTGSATNDLAFVTEHSNTKAERLRIKSDGKVGIGTTNPSQKLNVYNSTASDTGGVLIQNVTYSGNEDRPYLTVGTKGWTGATTNWNTYGFQHRIKSNSGGSPRITVDTNTGEKFCINNNGRVGIGTDDPQKKLHVYGEVMSGGNISGSYVINLNPSASGPILEFGDVADPDEFMTLGAYNGRNNLAIANRDFRISSSSVTNLVYIADDTGNIGIGTDSPLAKLEVKDGSVYVPGGTFDASSLGAGNDSKTDAALVIERGSEIYTQGGGYLRTLIGSDGTVINIGQQNTSLISEINLKPGNADTNGVKLHHGGTADNVKLQTTGYGVTITGGINVSGVATATDFNSASDENLKTNIRTIEDPLAKVIQIRGVNFDWKETQRPSLGVIAQEVEKVLPELVTDNGTKTVNYNGLIGLLIETVKEQQKQIDTLSERLSKLE